MSPRSKSPRARGGRSRSPIFDSDNDSDGGDGELAHLLRKALLHPEAGRGRGGDTRTVTDFKTKFAKLDRGRKGVLSRGDFKKAIMDMGPLKLSRGQWDELFEKVEDDEGRGKIEYGEVRAVG